VRVGLCHVCSLYLEGGDRCEQILLAVERGAGMIRVVKGWGVYGSLRVCGVWCSIDCPSVTGCSSCSCPPEVRA
jgi:hypothetical protein